MRATNFLYLKDENMGFGECIKKGLQHVTCSFCFSYSSLIFINSASLFDSSPKGLVQLHYFSSNQIICN